MRRMRNIKICPIISAKLTSQSIEELPVIVQVRNESYDEFQSIVSQTGKVKTNLPIIGGVACNLTTDAIYRLANDPNIEYISFDSKVFALLDIATASINTRFPHERGYLGEGTTVAVIDSGVAPHQDLTIPTNRIIGFKDFINNKIEPYDDNGHGTHVSGIIAGNGYSSKGRYTGVAPKSNILAIKALDENGSGNTSDIIKAISWVVETKNKYRTDIINLSLGSPVNNDCSADPLCRAVSKAIDKGLIVVAAAGNSGPKANTILSPGISPKVITVGAVDDKNTPNIDDDTIADFSSRGPTREGLQKPDLVAPGVNIKSLSNITNDRYTTLSGTSMATPLISGSIALLMSRNKNLSHNDIKNKLMNSCIALNESKDKQGAGILSLEKLFYDENINSTFPSSQINSKNIAESFLVLLLVLFLLDKK